MKPIQIELDYKFNTHPVIEMVQGTVAPFEIAIFDNYEEEKLSSATITINMLKADETFIALTSGINKVNNTINFISPKDFTRESGKGKIQVIIKGDEFEVYTWEIDVNIIPAAINDDNVPSENIIPIIEEIQSKINETLELKKVLDQWISDNQNLTDVQNRLTISERDISVLKEKTTTNINKISGIEGTVNNLTSDLGTTSQKANQTEIDLNSFKNLFNGGIGDMEAWFVIPTSSGEKIIIESKRVSSVPVGSAGTYYPDHMSRIRTCFVTAHTGGTAEVGVVNNRDSVQIKHNASNTINVMLLMIGTGEK